MSPGRKPGTRRKTGGRKKGTPNKRSLETAALIESCLKGKSPLDVMATLAQELLDAKYELHKPMVVNKEIEFVYDRGYEFELAIKLLSDVAQYHSPKRKAIELTTDTDRPVSFVMEIKK